MRMSRGRKPLTLTMPADSGRTHTHKTSRRRWLPNTIKLAVSGAIFYYIFSRYIRYEDFVTAWRYVQPGMVVYLLLLSFGGRYLSAYQIHYYFRKAFDKALGTNFVFRAQLISSFYGLVLPGDLAGGLITWYMIADKSGERAASASVIIFLRLLGIITLIVFTAVGLAFEDRLIDLDLRMYMFGTAILFLLLFVPFVSSRAALGTKRITRAFIRSIPFAAWQGRLDRLNERVWDSVIACTRIDPGVMLWTVGMSILYHLLLIGFAYLLMIMVGIDLPFQVSVWLLGAVNLIQMLPVSFLGLGVRDISIIYLLGKYYQVTPESSLILSTFFLAFSLIFILLGGLAVLAGGAVDRLKVSEYAQAE